MATLDQAPIYEFNWLKEGVPAISTLPYGVALIIVQDDTVQTFTLKEYQRFGDILPADFTADNLAYFADMFTYPITKLYVYRIDVAGTIDQTVQDDILGTTFDYGVYPEAETLDYTTIISMVRAGRTDYRTLKWVMPKQTVNPDEPWFIQLDLVGAADAEGNVISVGDFLPTLTAQRAAKPLTQSLTYDVLGKVATFTQSTDIPADLTLGIMVPKKINNAIRYVRDINTLVTMGDQYDQRFRENQRFATMDTINRDIRHTWETQYVGNFQNSGDNKRAFIGALNKYIKDRANSPTDPVQDGLFYIDWEEHRDILRAAGKTEAEINALDISALEDIDTSTFVYIDGQVQINGVMEDIRFNVTLATTVVTPVELQG